MKQVSGVVGGLLLALILAGCVTHRINWAGRIGNYTYDQAIEEFGPPDKQAKLTDGRLVAEWISRYYNNSTVIVGAGLYGYPGGGGIIQTTPNYYESKLRLTFGTNHVLSAWSKD
jgi:hypothetical protein